MATIAGDFKLITAANDKLGKTYSFYPMANESNTIRLGGATVDDNEDGVAGGGAESVFSISNTMGGFTITVANDSVQRRDLENAKELITSGEESVFTIEHINGSIYKVSGMIVGQLETDTQAGTFEMKVNGKVERVA